MDRNGQKKSTNSSQPCSISIAIDNWFNKHLTDHLGDR